MFNSTGYACHALANNALKKKLLEKLLERSNTVIGSKVSAFESTGKAYFSTSHKTWFSELKSSLGTEAGQLQSSFRNLGLKETLRCYGKLSKIRLSGFVMSTACAGYVLGSGESVDWPGMLWTGLGTLGAAACANTMNQVMEVKNDALMSRTMSRPLPSGRMSRTHAIAFAIMSGCLGIAILANKTNSMTATLGAANIFLYAGVYTPLKQITPFNTWMGAIVGAIPPLMGWAAASGKLDPGAWILAATLYFWQIPHFLSLAWVCKDDYIKAGYEMLSKYDPQGKRLASISLRNCYYMFPLGILSAASGVTTSAFGYEAGMLTVALALSTSVFYSKPSKKLGRATFRASLVFLPIFMAMMLLHRLPNHQNITWSDVKDKILGKCLELVGDKNKQRSIVDRPNHLESFQIAPFPFVMLPLAIPSDINLWEGLDEIILQEELLRKEKDH